MNEIKKERKESPTELDLVSDMKPCKQWILFCSNNYVVKSLEFKISQKG